MCDLPSRLTRPVTNRKPMAPENDPTDDIRKQAASFPDVAEGTTWEQATFKASKGSFLLTGRGLEGLGFKAMFKLKASLEQAQGLAVKDPARFQVGAASWVTTRFSAEEPLPKFIWEKWLKESYSLNSSPPAKARRKSRKKVKQAE
jgi:hypothetical protein